MLKCVCNVDWGWLKWSCCPLLDRTRAEQICFWDNNKCLVAELNYGAYRSRVIVLLYTGASCLREMSHLYRTGWKNVTSHTDVKQEMCRSSGFCRCVAENCAVLGCYPANSCRFLPTFRVPSSGFKNQFSWIQEMWDLTLIWRLLSSLVWRRVIWYKYLGRPRIYRDDGGTRVL